MLLLHWRNDHLAIWVFCFLLDLLQIATQLEIIVQFICPSLFYCGTFTLHTELGINAACLWYIFFLIHSWIQFAGMLLRIFASMAGECWLVIFFFFCRTLLQNCYQGNASFIEWVTKECFCLFMIFCCFFFNKVWEGFMLDFLWINLMSMCIFQLERT